VVSAGLDSLRISRRFGLAVRPRRKQREDISVSPRRLAPLTLTLAVALTVSGCALLPESPAQLAERFHPAAALSTPAAPLDSSLAVNVRGEQVRRPSGAVAGLALRWGTLTDDAKADAALRRVVRAAVNEHATVLGTKYAPAPSALTDGGRQRGCVAGSTLREATDVLDDHRLATDAVPHQPRLVVTCDLVMAAGPYTAERVRVLRTDGEAVVADYTAVIVAGIDADSRTADTLLLPESKDALIDHVAAALADDARIDPVVLARWVPELRAADLATLAADLVLLDDGALSLRVTPPNELVRSAEDTEGVGNWRDDVPVWYLPPGTEIPDPGPEQLLVAGQLTIRIAPAATAPLLSAAGSAVRDAVIADLAPSAPSVTAGSARVDCALLPCLALTFDDGPAPGTDAVVAALNERDQAATFFVVGRQVPFRAETVRRMHESGHLVASHTWDHPNLTGQTREQLERQLGRTADAIEAATGARPGYFRPPYGAVNATVMRVAGMPAVLWSVDPEDWREPPKATLVRAATKNVRAGDIVLLHDIHAPTVVALPEILDVYQAQGFRLVTIKQLLAGKEISSTAIINSAHLIR